jgi:hypothetical protein
MKLWKMESGYNVLFSFSQELNQKKGRKEIFISNSIQTTTNTVSDIHSTYFESRNTKPQTLIVLESDSVTAKLRHSFLFTRKTKPT